MRKTKSIEGVMMRSLKCSFFNRCDHSSMSAEIK